MKKLYGWISGFVTGIVITLFFCFVMHTNYIKDIKKESMTYKYMYLSCLTYIEFNIASPRHWWIKKGKTYEQCRREFIEDRAKFAAMLMEKYESR
jgi:hypothetical protein